MDGKGMRLLAGVSLLLGLAVSTGRAEELLWRPVTATPPAAAAPTSPGPAASIGRPEPSATLGRPVPVGQPVDAVDPPFTAGAAASPAIFSGASVPVGSQPAIIRCEAPGDVQPVQLSGPPPVPPPPPPSGAPYGGEPYNPGVAIDHPLNKTFGDRCGEFFGFNAGGANSSCNRAPFQSDHAFDCLISPVSNPFHFEDPRSLTEIKPLFIYQVSPKNNPVFNGGGSEFYGLQGRLALNEHWSVVINKLGFVSMQPKNTDDEFRKATGFAELNIGPKWTFYRNEQTGGIAATGLNFEIPTGAKKVFQDTGTLGLDPYITAARSFGRLPSGYGQFNAMGELGYNFAVDNKQTEFLHGSLHLDYDVANLHKFYPLIEFNYFNFTKLGREGAFGFTGADLFDFGSSTLDHGRNLFTLAFGLRYKLTENFQTGLAFEFPLSDQKALQSFRLGLDFIFRY
jgi:hypothetical protein